MLLPIFLILASVLTVPTPLSAQAETTLSQNPETVGAYVRHYYAETPVLATIAWCESRMRQWNKNGNVFRGAVNHNDVGIMQINSLYHEKRATDIGLDIYTLSGNLEYAKYLYGKEGTEPWTSSEACWGKVASK